ncbi:MAG TPA: hypothetical protein VFE33_20055 [Thermoanaerobaculia bacterium]|nr:hypothetical protein [Thermoanaerobaculia bacterium]
MLSDIGIFAALESPFPGLRAFEIEESLLFFGRETHAEELLRRLSESRFLAVVGSSGCGKSSLVRAGLLPALFRGYLPSATSRWRFAILRPGSAPIDALAAALTQEGVLGSQDVTKLRETLAATSGGLVEAVRQAGFAPGESLLVVVDQFEEIFRFAPDSQPGESQAPLFVSLLLHAVESDAPIYVALTMRSEYQGDCAQFPGLPEALNRSQYLVPRLTRDERRQAIVRPLQLVETDAAPRLVNRLLNDVGDDPDQLPVLQHALLQTYRHWQGAGGHGGIDLSDYEEIGGIANALGRHGDEILAELSKADQRLAEAIFRSLTTTERGRIVRRPKTLGAIHAVVNAADKAAQGRVNAIISTFARREHSLLMLSKSALEPDTVVDITHESLMRKWPRLAAWIKEEARSAEWYSDLARDVARYRTRDAGLWRDPALSGVLQRRDQENWNVAWALQCSQPGDPPFVEVQTFLDASGESQAADRRREQRQRRRTSITLLLLLVTIVVAGAMIWFTNRQKERAIEEFVTLQKRQGEAQSAAEQAQAEYQKARNGTIEQSSKLELLSQNAKILKAKADGLESQLDVLRKNEALASSDHSFLLTRIQELQGQLNAATTQRDRLRPEIAISNNPDPVLQKRIEDLQAQLSTATTERDQLRSAAARERPAAGPLRAATRPIVKVIPQFSLVHLSTAPFAGSVAIAVGDVHTDNSSNVRVYIWTTDGGAALPAIFTHDRKLSDRKLDRLDRGSCNADGVPSCYRTRKIDVVLGHQVPGTFVVGGARYEILATGWNNEVRGQEDSIALALYPAPAVPAAR